MIQTLLQVTVLTSTLTAGAGESGSLFTPTSDDPVRTAVSCYRGDTPEVGVM